MSDSRLDATWQPILAGIAERVESIRSTMASDPTAALEDAADLGVGIVATLLRGRGCDFMNDVNGEVSQHLNDVCRILSGAWEDAAVRRAFSALQPQVVRLGDVCGASWHEVAIHVAWSARQAVLHGMIGDDPAIRHKWAEAMLGGDWFPDAVIVADRWEAICDLLPTLTDADCEALQVSLTKERTQRTADSKADSKKKNPEKDGPPIPQNDDVSRLALLISRERDARRKLKDIALEFTDGDVKKAESLLRQLRRFKHLRRKRGG